MKSAAAAGRVARTSKPSKSGIRMTVVEIMNPDYGRAACRTMNQRSNGATRPASAYKNYV
jgi:hypothetical protein